MLTAVVRSAFQVTGFTSGASAVVNTTSTVTSTEGGTGNSATATIYIKEPTPDLNVLKQIGLAANPAGVWSKFQGISSLPTDVYYKFTVENIGDVDLTNVSITDAALTGAGVSLAVCSWANLTTVDPIQECVVGPLTVSSAGKLTNTATANGSYGATPDTSQIPLRLPMARTKSAWIRPFHQTIL